MKITEIEIKHFRGFPGPSAYTFELPGGKSLLLYGENGSGKSSLFHALEQLFNIDTHAMPFSDMANLFGKDEAGNDFADGSVKVRFNDVPSTCLTWSQAGTRPTDNPLLVDAAMRKGCLDYRSLLRTSFGGDDLESRLFMLAVTVLLPHIPAPSLAGIPQTLGDYWATVRCPPNHHKSRLRTAERGINLFNEAFKAVLPDVQKEASALLARFVGTNLDLELQFDDLIYDIKTRKILNQKLHLKIQYNGKSIARFESVLNEARLTALALSMCLASVKLSNPVPRAAVSPVRILVLDDVLIGLDLSNRLPLLDVLRSDFSDYQVFLMTYDRVWYELAHRLTEPTNDWVYRELYADRVGNPGYDVPVQIGGGDLLHKARVHLRSHDYRAAAVYARAAFEARLKDFCTHRRLPVRYNQDSGKVSSEDLWQAATKAETAGIRCVDTVCKAKIESLRKVVLNPLSHSDSNSVTRVEVEAAIEAVQALPF